MDYRANQRIVLPVLINLFVAGLLLSAGGATWPGATKPVTWMTPGNAGQPKALAGLLPAAGATVRLGPIDAAAIERAQALNPSAGKGVLQTGVRRKLPQAVDLGGAGGKTGAAAGAAQALNLVVEGAFAVRVRLSNVDLPDGAQVIVYNTDNPSEQVGPYTAAYVLGRDEFWTETVFSPHVTVVLQPGPAALRLPRARVAEVVHIYRDLAQLMQPKVGACHQDITCYPDWTNTARGVAGIGSINEVGSLWCTGCLLNDQDPYTFEDYFMTANHCIGNQAKADTTEYYWFYQSAYCNGPVPSPSAVPRTGGGADYLAGLSRSAGNDFAFLYLRLPAPGGVTYAGWTTTAPGPGHVLTGIHHPDGSYKRISFGLSTGSTPNYWSIRWQLGVTEPGSSGSPIFNPAQLFIGQLWGGDSSCENPAGIDQYGRFDVSYPIVKAWLEKTPVPCVTWGWAQTGPVPADYDGDGKADVAVFNPYDGTWYVMFSSGGTLVGGSGGWAGTRAGPADYDGDKKADFAVYYPAAGNWYVAYSAGGYLIGQNWGWSGAEPVPADYDGDGKTDLAVFDPAVGNWYVAYSAGGAPLMGFNWGWAGTTPVPADYDGDKKADLAVYHQPSGTWYIKYSSGATPLVGGSWGWSAAVPVPQDYDGDGRTDIAVFHQALGNWYIIYSSGAAPLVGGNWGWSVTAPVPRDYNGDKKADFAVFYQLRGRWYIK